MLGEEERPHAVLLTIVRTRTRNILCLDTRFLALTSLEEA